MNTSALKQAALELPEQERAHLVHVLLDSLDQPSESDVEQLWLHEAACRAAEIDQSKVRLVTAEELEIRAKALLG